MILKKPTFFVLLLFGFTLCFGQSPIPKWELSAGVGATNIFYWIGVMPGGRIGVTRQIPLNSWLSLKPSLGLSSINNRYRRLQTNNQGLLIDTRTHYFLTYLDITPFLDVRITPKFHVGFAPYAAYMPYMVATRSRRYYNNGALFDFAREYNGGNYFYRSVDIGLRAYFQIQVHPKVQFLVMASHGLSNIFPSEVSIFGWDDPRYLAKSLNVGLTFGLPSHRKTANQP